MGKKISQDQNQGMKRMVTRRMKQMLQRKTQYNNGTRTSMIVARV